MIKNRRSCIGIIYLKLLIMNNKKFWFTLIELLITISMIGVLTVILFRTYNTISLISFRTQQEKKIQQELIWTNQTLQNIADNHSLNFDQQINTEKTDTLYLSWLLGNITITSTGICKPDFPLITWFNEEEKNNPCTLIIINSSWVITNITTPSESSISKPYFTIFPFKDNNAIIQDSQIEFPLLYIKQPSFLIHFSIYSPLYEKWNRIRTSSILFQQFFNLQ